MVVTSRLGSGEEARARPKGQGHCVRVVVGELCRAAESPWELQRRAVIMMTNRVVSGGRSRGVWWSRRQGGVGAGWG